VGTASAGLIEEVAEVPVQVVDIDGRFIRHQITVTIFRDDSRTPSPFLILNHGRAGRESDRIKLGRARYSDNAAYFVSEGFAVFVPTRVGYGVTGGPDVENAGNCQTRDYRPVFEAAARQNMQVIRYAKTLSYVDPTKGLVVGQSFGGATAIALASKNIPGVFGAVNFAGGSGGNPDQHPERPCRDDLLSELFSSYAATARIPTLWLYSENDRYWGRI
jgi:dienelactone hydrolase